MRTRKKLYRYSVPDDYRIDSEGPADPDDLARFINSETIESANLKLSNGIIVDPIALKRVDLISPQNTLNDITAAAGILTLNFSDGILFRFTHAEDIILNFANIPQPSVVMFELLRISAGGTPTEIDWENSTGTFIFPGGQPPFLSITQDATDILYLTTYDGGGTFLVDSALNYA